MIIHADRANRRSRQWTSRNIVWIAGTSILLSLATSALCTFFAYHRVLRVTPAPIVFPVERGGKIYWANRSLSAFGEDWSVIEEPAYARNHPVVPALPRLVFIPDGVDQWSHTLVVRFVVRIGSVHWVPGQTNEKVLVGGAIAPIGVATLVAGSFVFTCLAQYALRQAVRRYRRRHDRCEHCAYLLAGLAVEQVCPECGESITRADRCSKANRALLAR